ncbi:hypothetical protein GcC1_045017 [Golovinomyces cichoracearum]|uniref:Uncharacterized protein n=1 Tax=Golovinomyces cichoracearum TaxID=62708 RepID=A0A420IYC3_9PEZI|nr:hypothetical protein GcC1_045017 [Golovinomyces cichoracearum]
MSADELIPDLSLVYFAVIMIEATISENVLESMSTIILMSKKTLLFDQKSDRIKRKYHLADSEFERKTLTCSKTQSPKHVLASRVSAVA